MVVQKFFIYQHDEEDINKKKVVRAGMLLAGGLTEAIAIAESYITALARDSIPGSVFSWDVLPDEYFGSMFAVLTHPHIDPGDLKPDELAHTLELIKHQQVIHAIKFVRERTGAGLKEAKEFVDKTRDDLQFMKIEEPRK